MAIIENGQVAYVGRTVAVRSYEAFEWERWVATVVEDDGSISTKEIGAAHIGGAGSVPQYEVDADEAAQAAYRSHKWASMVARLQAEDYTKAIELVKGAQVVVCKGRKVKVGTTGTVKVVYDGSYGERVLITTDDGQDVWVAAANVVVTDQWVVDHLTPIAELKRRAGEYIARYSIRQLAA